MFSPFFFLLLFSVCFVFSIFFCRFSLFCTLICASSMQLDGLVCLKVMLQSFISAQLICFARRLPHVQFTCIFVRFVFCHHKYTHATSATVTTKPKTATTLNKRRSTKIYTKYWAMHILSTCLSDLKEEKKTVQFTSEKSRNALPLWIILLHFAKIIFDDILGFTRKYRWFWSLFFLIFKWKSNDAATTATHHRSIHAKLYSDCCNTLHTAWCEREFQSRKLHTHAERILDWWLCWYLSSWNWSPVKQ